MKKNYLKIVASIGMVWSIYACKPADLTPSSSETVLSQSFATAPGVNFVPDEILIKFAAGTSDAKKAEVLAKIQGKMKEHILTKSMLANGDTQGLALVKLPGQALNALSKIAGVIEIEYAEPNYIFNHNATSNDTYFTTGNMWGMYGLSTTPSNAYGSNAATAWANGHIGSSTVYVGIIDEGYMYTHTDLAPNAGVNNKEIPNNGIDDDKNGYIDDVYGWDFANGDNTIFDGVGDDHGTHVAGTIGAVGGNNMGVAGVNWNVKLLDAKFLSSTGGTLANAVKAVDYFTGLKLYNGMNIVATNNSWGGGGYSKSLYSAIERANKAGILFIAAAGNSSSNNDATASYPSGYPNANVIAVAAIGSDGTLAYFSNYGAKTVDLGAPGVTILSTVPASSNGSIVSAYANYSGTSMATPHVTGAAALYLSSHPGATAATIKNAILSSTTATASLSGKCVTGGRLNVGGF